jgi:hypothetical protein
VLGSKALQEDQSIDPQNKTTSRNIQHRRFTTTNADLFERKAAQTQRNQQSLNQNGRIRNGSLIRGTATNHFAQRNNSHTISNKSMIGIAPDHLIPQQLLDESIVEMQHLSFIPGMSIDQHLSMTQVHE